MLHGLVVTFALLVLYSTADNGAADNGAADNGAADNGVLKGDSSGGGINDAIHKAYLNHSQNGRPKTINERFAESKGSGIPHAHDMRRMFLEAYETFRGRGELEVEYIVGYYWRSGITNYKPFVQNCIRVYNT